MEEHGDRLELPLPQNTIYEYIPVAIHERLAFVAGQIPKTADGKLLVEGICGDDVTLDQAEKACRLSVDQALAWLDREAGGIANIARILRMDVFIASTREFESLSAIADAGSRRLIAAIGEAGGRHPRSVIGVMRLPRNAPVLVELTVALRRAPDK